MKIRALFNRFFSKGFTLIELLIAIAIIGILAGGILFAIDPLDKINSANDAKVINDVSVMGRAAEAYAITHNGLYPLMNFPDDPLPLLNDLVNSGELKRLPVAPGGYRTYSFLPLKPDGNQNDDCTEPACVTGTLISGELKSKKYSTVPNWSYNSVNGASCANTMRPGSPHAWLCQ
jgi:prepilin-type N-terminal cleavage/methylation domain-containing protein